MTDKKDDPSKVAGGSGKASPSSPDPKRPHAVIDLKATEVVVNKPFDASKPDASKDSKPAAATATTGAAGGSAAGTSVPPASAAAKPADPKPADAKPATAASATTSSKDTGKDAAKAPLNAAPAAPAASVAKRSGGFVSHLAAGVVGGALALVGGQVAAPMLGLDLSGSSQPAPDLAKRLAALEQQSQRPAAASADAQKLATAESRLAKLEETAAALARQQTTVAADTKALDDKIAAVNGTDNAGTRLAKLEADLKSLVDAANNDPRNAGRLPQLAQLTAKIGEMETSLVTRTTTVRREIGQEMDQRFAQTAEQAESARSRLAARTQALEQSLKSVSDETGAIRTAVDAVKSDVENKFKMAAKPADVQSALAPVATKLTAIEQSVQGVVKSEQDRNATAGNILLSLELTNLKRALDRGGKYASELAAVKKLAGGKLDLAVLEAQQNTGVPSSQTLAAELRSLAHAMLDAEAEPADASVTDRMLSGFKSIVRVRKTSVSADDKSTEATIARMEKALTESRLADVLEEAKKLPAKAAAPAQNWLQRIEARYQVDKALAALEASLKTSLAGGAAPAKGN